MSLRNFIGTLTMALAPILVGMAGFWLLTAHYRLALAATLLVVVCMELRVRLGWRLPRKPTFLLHILLGILLLVALGLLALKPMPLWLIWAALALLVTVAVGGGAKLVEQYLRLG